MKDIQLHIDPRSVQIAARTADKAARGAVGPAIVEALTVIALRGRKAEQDNMRKVLDHPTPFAIASVVAVPATRQQDGSLQSNIYVRGAMVAILLRLEYGGVLETGLAIVEASLKDAYGSLGPGGITRVLSMPGAYEGELGGQRGVYQRQEDGSIKLLIAYITNAEYDPMLGYNKTARKAGESFTDEVERQLHKRLKGAGYA